MSVWEKTESGEKNQADDALDWICHDIFPLPFHSGCVDDERRFERGRPSPEKKVAARSRIYR